MARSIGATVYGPGEPSAQSFRVAAALRACGTVHHGVRGGQASCACAEASSSCLCSQRAYSSSSFLPASR
jgi:hypothetical protein